MTAALILVGAYLLDVFAGDPPNRWHPVAWMGQWIGWARNMAPKQGNRSRFLFGMAFVVLSCAIIALIAWGIQTTAAWIPLYVSIPMQACILTCSFSTRSLARAAQAVWSPLQGNDLVEARHQLSYHLVSRDTSQLDESQVSAAVIESVSENTSDSVVAPVLFFCVAGLPGAMVYRFVNTCDAMWGYRTDEFEWLGKFAARLDDVLNWIPARLTAMIMLVIAGVTGGNWIRGMRIWWRDRYQTESPNAGQPMSVAAGLLGVELEKVGHYCLGQGLEKPNGEHIRLAIRLLWMSSLAFTFLSVTGLVLVDAFK
jgi:adenosylcobinamide-phosphate synthase